MTTTCSNCGTNNREGAKFCKGCGQSFGDVAAGSQNFEVAGFSCSACEHVNRAEARFCAKCGAQLVPSAPSPQSPPLPRIATAKLPERPPISAGVVARSASDATGPPPSRKRAAAWLALGLVAIAIAGTTAWWTLGRPSSKPTPVASDATAPTLAPAVVNATPKAAAQPSVPAAPIPAAATTAPVPEQIPPVAERPGPVPEASPPAAVTTPTDEPDKEAAEREAAERRAMAQAARAKAALEAHNRAVAAQKRQENERMMIERDVARRQAEQQRVQAERNARDAAAARFPPPPFNQPRYQQPPQSMTVRDQCARAGNPINQAVCEVRECINPKNWNDAYCRQQREGNQQGRPGN